MMQGKSTGKENVRLKLKKCIVKFGKRDLESGLILQRFAIRKTPYMLSFTIIFSSIPLLSNSTVTQYVGFVSTKRGER